MNYQKLIVVDNATRDAQPRQSKDGEKTFTTFDVGVSDGNDKTAYFPVVVFGKQGEAVAKNVTKGRLRDLRTRLAGGSSLRVQIFGEVNHQSGYEDNLYRQGIAVRILPARVQFNSLLGQPC